MQPKTTAGALANSVPPPQPKPWVKLHFEAQHERSNMPDFIVGVLQKETPTHYVLSNVLEENEDFDTVERKEMDFFSKTYVWRCEIIGAQKPFISTSEDDEEGGLG